MKRIAFITCIVLLAGINCKAASDNDSTRYLASTMKQNWFITANASVNWWQGSDRNPAGNYTSLNGPTFGGGVSFGKWITHNIALRLAYDVNRSHSYINGLHTADHQRAQYDFLYANNPTPDANGYCATTFMYHNLHADVMLSPLDLIQGFYNPERFFTPIIFVGMGGACVSGRLSVIQSIIEKKRNFELSADAGVMGLFKLNSQLDLFLSFLWTAQEYHIDSWRNEYGVSNPEQRRPRIADFNYSGQLGLNWSIRGRVYELPYNYENEMKELRERLQQCEEAMTTPDGNTVTVTEQVYDTVFITSPGEFVSYPLSIFFNRDSYELMSSRDLVNLREIAKVAMDHGCKIKLRGSCDSATASAEYNQRLSENRCNKVKQELMKLGVPEGRITYDAVGGVKELDPTKYDRRVIITLIKDN